jgi:hypothetical protein
MGNLLKSGGDRDPEILEQVISLSCSEAIFS